MEEGGECNSSSDSLFSYFLNLFAVLFLLYISWVPKSQSYDDLKLGLTRMNWLTLTPLNVTKYYCGKCKKILTTTSTQGLYTYRIAAWAASQPWLGMGGQGICVREVPGSIPGGITHFDGVSFKWDRLVERKDSEKVSGLRKIHWVNSSQVPP